MKSPVETPEFYDVGEIINPDSDVGIAFQKFMEPLAQKILGEKYDPRKHKNLRFLLSNKEEIGGYIATEADPMAVVIHKGSILNLPYEDQFAHIVGHELAHMLIQETIDDHDNGKVEEGSADDISATMLAASGYNLDVVENMFRHFQEPANYYIYQIINSGQLYSVHPQWSTRLSILQRARVQANRSGVAFNTPPMQMPVFLLELAKNAKYVSKTDIFARAAAASFEDMSFFDRLDWLVGQANALPREHQTNDITEHSNDIYKKQIASLFEHTTADPSNIQQTTAYKNAFNRMMRTGRWKGSSAFNLHESAMKGLCYKIDNNDEDITLIGFLDDMSRIAHNLMAAKTSEIANEQAKKLLEIYHEYADCFEVDSRKTRLTDKLGLGKARAKNPKEIEDELNENRPVEIPLLRQHIWAKEDDKQAIGTALQLLIGGRYHPAQSLNFETRRPGLFYNNFHNIEDYERNYHINDGCLTSIKRKPVLFLHQTGRFYLDFQGKYGADRLMQERKEWEEDLLKNGVDWDLLIKNPEDFFYIYKQAIDPFLTARPYPYPFAEAMINFIRKQAEERPDIVTTEKRWELMLAFSRHWDPTTIREKDIIDPIYGIDQDHPVVHEYWHVIKQRFVMKPDDLQTYVDLPIYNSQHNYIKYTRILPFLPLTGLAATLKDWNTTWDFNEEFFYSSLPPIGRAYLVEEIKKISKEGISKNSFLKLLACHNAISDYRREYDDAPSIKWHARHLEKRLEKQILAKISALKETADPTALIAWHIKAQENWRKLPSDEALKLWHQTIIDKIKVQQDADKKSELLGKYIGSHQEVKTRFRPKYLPASTSIRKQMSALLVEDISRGLGVDDGSQNFSVLLTGRLEKHLACIKGRLSSDLVKETASHVQAQPRLAYELERIWKQHISNNAIQSELEATVLEAAMLGISRDTELKAGLFEFLSRPLSDQSLIKAQEAIVLNNYATRGRITADKQMSFLSRLHTELWEAEMPLRALFFKEILFPHEIDQKTAKHISHSLIDRIINNKKDKPFTAKDLDPFSSDNKVQSAYISAKYHISCIGTNIRSAWKRSRSSFGLRAKLDSKEAAKLIVDSYLDVIGQHDPIEARFLISALIAAEHNRADKESLKLGETLYTILSHMGPAGANLIQAIDNNPSTPADIREGLGKGKTQHDIPLWWDITRQMEEAGVLSPDKTERVCSILGCGKFGITMLNKTPTGDEVADTILRRNALKITEREFYFMEQAAHIIVQKEPRLKPIIGMIQQARYSAYIETNMPLAIKQNELAKRVYDDIVVSIKTDDGNIVMTNKVMDITEAGIENKRAAVAEGSHFLDLEDGSDSKFACALAGLATQLSLRLAGLPVERDRHGGNTKYKNGTIQHFDTAMMDLDFPSMDEKRKLGELLATSVKSSIISGNFIDCLTQNLEKEAAQNQFFAKIRQEILGCGDYIKAINDCAGENAKDVFAGILGSALLGDSADPIIQKSFEHKLGILGDKVKLYFADASDKCPVRISNIPNPESIVLPLLSQQERALVDGILPTTDFGASIREFIPIENTRQEKKRPHVRSHAFLWQPTMS